VIGKKQPEPLGRLASESRKPILYISGEPDMAVTRQFHDLVAGAGTPPPIIF
jgi:hypothetical protein